MNRGIVTTAVTPEQVRLATCLAYSVGIYNKTPVTLIVNDLDIVTSEQEEPFDKIIEFPFSRSKTETLRANDWQIYWSTPYDETLFLDCHQLVKTNLDSAIDYLSDHFDLYFNTSIHDFRYDQIPNLDHQIYKEYCDTRVYSNIIFFRKDAQLAMDYFKIMDPILKDWRSAFDALVKKQHVPEYLDIDLLNSIVLHNMDMIDKIKGYPVFNTISLKAGNYIYKKHINTSYLEYLNIWNTDSADIKIQNFKAIGVIDYYDPNFVTEDILNANRDNYRELTKRL